jgi:hypothetical protein
MNHKIEINIEDEDIRVIESIINSNDDTLVSNLTLEDAVTLGILKQILREMEFHDGWIRLNAQDGDTNDK